MYIFDSKEVDAQSIIHAINLVLGENIVGAEIGTYSAQSACTIIQNCPSIKKLYVIDSWKPYSDFIKEPYDNVPALVFDEKKIEYIKLTALHNIKYSGYSEKIHVMEMDSDDASFQIDDSSLDFIFLDAHLTVEQLFNDLTIWYPKVKAGGLVAVHDTHVSSVANTIKSFMKNNVETKISSFDKTYVWIK